MKTRAALLCVVLACLIPLGCGGSESLEFVLGFIEGPGVVEEHLDIAYWIEASGDTGITYQWAVYPPSAGHLADQTTAKCIFSPWGVAEDTTVKIQVVVDSDNTDPTAQSRDIVIKDVGEEDGLRVGEIFGPTVLDENSSVEYSVLAGGDAGITYQWSCVPSDVGGFDPPDASSTVFSTAEVEENTQVTIQVEVNSHEGGPIVKTLDVTVHDVPPVPFLDVSQIDGAPSVYELSTEIYSVTATGDSGIGYEWSCDPSNAGVFVSPASSVTDFTASEVAEDGEVVIRVEVNSDNFGPEVRTLAVSVLNLDLEVGLIIGPPAITEYSSGTYSVEASGDTGISYAWSCDPSNAGVLDSPYSSSTDFIAAAVTGDTQVQLTVEVSSDHASPVMRNLDILVRDSQLIVSEISGPTVAGENSWATYSIDAAGDTGISIEWSCNPSGAGVYETPYSSSTRFLPAWVSEDTGIEISVEVVSDHAGPVLRTLDLTVLNQPTSGWSQTWGGSDTDEGYAAAVDINGNVYVTGHFQDVVDFDPGVGVDEFASNGGSDTFLAKFDPSGAHLWALTWGGSGEDYGSGVAVDTAGDIYVTGCFEGAVDFDPGGGIETHSGGTGFLTKFNSSGAHLWAQTWVSQCTGVAVDELGNIFVTGGFEGTVDFYPGVGSDAHTSAGITDAFLCKYSSGGDFQWAKTWGGSFLDSGEGVAVDGNGDIYIAGGFSGAGVDFDPGAGTDVRSSNGAYDAYLSKLDSNGDYLWARTWGGDGGTWSLDWARDVAVSGLGEVYVTGAFYETADFDPGPGYDGHTANGEGDAFLCKYDSSGAYQWSATWGGVNSSAYNPDQGFGVSVDTYGDVYVTGCFWLSADFDPGPTLEARDSNGESDVFLTKLSMDGELVWARTWGGVGYDEGYGVAIESSGYTFATGFFSDLVDFDPGPDIQPHTSNGGRDAFLRMFRPDWGIIVGDD